MAKVTLSYSKQISVSDPGTKPVLIIGQLPHLLGVPFEVFKKKLEPRVTEQTFNLAVNNLHPSPTDTISMWCNNATLAALPLKVSRHNTSSRAHSIHKLVKSCYTGASEEHIVIVCERQNVFPSGCAVARAFPLFSHKSGYAKVSQRRVIVEFVVVGSNSRSVTDSEMEALTNAAAGIRLTQSIIDQPCNQMNTDAFVEEAKRVASEVGSEILIIRDEELNTKGFGGIYGVGKAAVHPPALVVLSHKPPEATQSIAWVGKGIVYDTGGLCIKSKTSMPGMKRDCGGAAAVLGAFKAAVKTGFRENLYAVLCLAENAVGPHATRPDDIHTMYSGRTVEINNTDAEGRLVLSDGVSYAAKDLRADIIVDVATLTGAQGISTGRYHAAVLCNREEWEQACVTSGRNSGDLVFPIVFSPELHFSEFASAVADMKNSVADRSNAQSSCAGLFIFSHLGFEFPGVWVHLDIASPCFSGERATGYGVALLLSLFGKASHSTLLQAVSPLGCSDEDEMVENATKKIRLV
ncbi:putative aminopeptidase NPEPL1-like [Apostichopus japonicus]|uniref:Putative aminopeptidase NPEPL1-like n=1 Tax=Stichopus japonicus TaxID=307972 RepID=A0A2G8KYZ1_STIJA|nr:putative aminopeptidase NPEPL1-like [Apostichopus japonicus]